MSASLRSLLPGAGIMLLLAAASATAQNGQPVGRGAMVGKQAPPFQLQGIYNESYSLETFKGHILVMQFGSSW